MKTFLSKLKIVELASVLAGPAVGMYFAEKGAEVIKIENSKVGGDVTRSWKLPSEKKNKSSSAYFCAANWGKQHLFLDLSLSLDFKQAISHIENADIVITNFKAGDAAKFGLDFDSLRKINASIILGEISGYGENNDKVAYDLILQAETGFMSMNGTPKSGPVKMPIAMIDILAAHQLKEGLLEALLEREVEKTAYHVHVSLYDAAIASLANQASNYLTANTVATRIGSKHPNIAPYGEIFKTSDNRFITFAIGSDKHFRLLCAYLGLTIDYPSNQDRVENREVIEELIAGKVMNLKSTEIITNLGKVHVPVGVIQNMKEVFENPASDNLLLKDEDGTRVKTSVYKIRKA